MPGLDLGKVVGGWLETVAVARRSSRYAADYVVAPDFAPIPYLALLYHALLYAIPCNMNPAMPHNSITFHYVVADFASIRTI